MLKVEGVDLGLAPAAAKSANTLVTAAPTKLSNPQPSVCLKWKALILLGLHFT